jgi:hypothetical protein
MGLIIAVSNEQFLPQNRDGVSQVGKLLREGVYVAFIELARYW